MPDAHEYAALAFAVGKAAKERFPGEVIIAPALWMFDWPFFDVIMRAGVLDVVDAVSVHPCAFRCFLFGACAQAFDGCRSVLGICVIDRVTMPETVVPELMKLRSILNGSTPVVVSEWCVLVDESF